MSGLAVEPDPVPGPPPPFGTPVLVCCSRLPGYRCCYQDDGESVTIWFPRGLYLATPEEWAVVRDLPGVKSGRATGELLVVLDKGAPWGGVPRRQAVEMIRISGHRPTLSRVLAWEQALKSPRPRVVQALNRALGLRQGIGRRRAGVRLT